METRILQNNDIRIVMEKALIKFEGKEFQADIIQGSEGEKAIDIRNLRKDTGCIVFDPGFANTASCLSEITFIHEDGILRYRGIPIEELAGKATFLEVAYLLMFGRLPTQSELQEFEKAVINNMPLHEGIKNLFSVYPPSMHPMAILASVVISLSGFSFEEDSTRQRSSLSIALQLLGQLPTIAAYSFKRSIGEPFIYPQTDKGYCENFLRMMFSHPSRNYEILPEVVEALELLLILHADHEQNCSTSTARVVRSSQANVFASVTAAICALWGPKHGGANEAVIHMLEKILEHKISVQQVLEKVKRKELLLMGFGHRVYKNYDPRAKIIKEACHRLLSKLNKKDNLLEVALELEQAALADDYFKERQLYPNVDFYSGIMYRAIGIPTRAFTVMFALGRLPGWLAHILEADRDPKYPLARPRQIYVGSPLTQYTPLSQRV